MARPRKKQFRGCVAGLEAWGCTDESRTNPYLVVFTERPNEMPIGPNIREDVTFHGYFLKLLSYEAQDDKRRMTPLLIGRLVWHPAPSTANSITTSPWFWRTVVGGMFLLSVFLYGTQRYANYQIARRQIGESERESVKHWLQDITSDNDSVSTKPSDEHNS